MHSQMHSQTLQALRAEIEAITTLQLALNRIALTVDDNSLTVWDGPRPEDMDDIAGDDGSFSRESVMDLRTQAGDALARRYVEVERVILGRAALESLVRSALATGTGGVITRKVLRRTRCSVRSLAVVRCGSTGRRRPRPRCARCSRRRKSHSRRGRRCLRLRSRRRASRSPPRRRSRSRRRSLRRRRSPRAKKKPARKAKKPAPKKKPAAKRRVGL